MKMPHETTIFLVEDDKVFQTMLAEYLRNRFGYIIETFTSGEECLKNLGHAPDIVLLDYHLLKQNGLEVLKEIKTLHPDVQVLTVSGQNNLNTAMEIMQNGAFGYLSKSENIFEEIAEKISEMRIVAAERKGLRKEAMVFFLAFVMTVIFLTYHLLR